MKKEHQEPLSRWEWAVLLGIALFAAYLVVSGNTLKMLIFIRELVRGNPYFNNSLLIYAGILLVYRDRIKGYALWLGLGVLLEVLLYELRHSAYPLQLLGPGLGLACAVRLAAASGSDSDIRRASIYGLAVPFTYMLGGVCLALFSQASAPVYDRYLYLVDRQLGLAYSFTVPAWMKRSALVLSLSYFAYSQLVTVMVLLQVAWLKWPERIRTNPSLVYILIGLLGGLCYAWIPGVGPSAFWPNLWPSGPLPEPTFPSVAMVYTSAERNQLPSLHCSWALCTAILGRDLGLPWNGLFLVWTGITAFVCFLGYHYAIDVLMAVPFTVAVVSLVRLTQFRQWDQLRCSIPTLSLVALFLFTIELVRDFPVIWANSPGLTRTLCALLLCLSFLCDLALRRAQKISPAASR